MPYTEWIDGVPYERLTPEERETKKAERKAEKEAKKQRKPGEVPKYIKGKKEGMDLENRVVARWNQSKDKQKNYNIKKRVSVDDLLDEPSEETGDVESSSVSSGSFLPPKKPVHGYAKEAKRQPNSGALWYAKGDVTLSHALVEVKERGTVNSRGEKTISIPKAWLTKQEEEAFQERRPYWYLAFAYKQDDSIYVIKDYDHEIEMVSELEKLQEENARLKQELEKRTDK